MRLKLGYLLVLSLTLALCCWKLNFTRGIWSKTKPLRFQCSFLFRRALTIISDKIWFWNPVIFCSISMHRSCWTPTRSLLIWTDIWVMFFASCTTLKMKQRSTRILERVESGEMKTSWKIYMLMKISPVSYINGVNKTDTSSATSLCVFPDDFAPIQKRRGWSTMPTVGRCKHFRTKATNQWQERHVHKFSWKQTHPPWEMSSPYFFRQTFIRKSGMCWTETITGRAKRRSWNTYLRTVLGEFRQKHDEKVWAGSRVIPQLYEKTSQRATHGSVSQPRMSL